MLSHTGLYPRLSSYFSLLPRHPPSPTLFPYTTLFRSAAPRDRLDLRRKYEPRAVARVEQRLDAEPLFYARDGAQIGRAHVELQSRVDLVCRLLLEKKKRKKRVHNEHSN